MMQTSALSPPTFIGFENYQRLFASAEFRKGLANVLAWAFWSVVIQIPLAFFIALSLVAHSKQAYKQASSDLLHGEHNALCDCSNARTVHLLLLGLVSYLRSLRGLAGPGCRTSISWEIQTKSFGRCLRLLMGLHRIWHIVFYGQYRTDTHGDPRGG